MSKNSETARIVKQWVEHAEEDLRLAKFALKITSSCPHKLIAFHAQQCAGVWYTLAYCHLREGVRTFALDCIKGVKETGMRYTIPPDFSMEEYFKAGWHIFRYGKPVEVKLRFKKEVARWITRRKWHPSQKVEKNKDGSIIFSVTLNRTKELRWWVYHWGQNCEVLSPPEFRKEVLAELKAMVGVYE